jgi:hypothetical protein
VFNFPLTSPRRNPLVHRKSCDLAVNDELAIGDPLKIGFRFRLGGVCSCERVRGHLSSTCRAKYCNSASRALCNIRCARSGWGESSYRRQIVCSCSGDQNLSRDRQVLHRQSGALSRIGCQAGMLLHQHSGDGAAHSNGTAQWVQCFSIRHCESAQKPQKNHRTRCGNGRASKRNASRISVSITS